jgi:hypothetical protein
MYHGHGVKRLPTVKTLSLADTGCSYMVVFEMLFYTSAVKLSDFAGYTGLTYREAREIPAHNVPQLWPKLFLFQTETDLYNPLIKT